MKMFLISLPITALFAALLYFGVVLNVDGAMNLAEFFIWFEFIVVILAIIMGNVNHQKPKPQNIIHTYFNSIFGVLVILFLVWFGHFWLAAIYSVSKILILGIRAEK